MRTHWAYGLAAALLTIFPDSAYGAEIPITVHWSGTAPSSVNVSTDGGLTPLAPDSTRKLFHGKISVAGSAPQRRTIIISYGTFNHPIDLRVHSILAEVSFGVDHRPETSCTSNKVHMLGRLSNNVADALNRTVGAGQILSIESPNDCDAALRLTAAQARYRQNVQMGQLSRGLFLVNPQIEQEYRQLASRNGLPADREIDAYAAAEASLEAVQLVAARDAAQAADDFASAARISSYMEQRIASDSAAREAFARKGVNADRLIADSRYLRALADREEAVEPND